MSRLLYAPFAVALAAWIGLGLRDASFRVQVLDDDGAAVSNAVVTALFNRASRDGFSSTLHQRVDAITDKNGMCTLSGRTTGYVTCGVTNSGYYRSSVDDISFRASRFGKLQPRKALYSCRLRKKVNPIPMYAMRFQSARLGTNAPWYGHPCGFDLLQGDWIAPLGKGETADFLFRLDQEKASLSTKDHFGRLQTIKTTRTTLSLSFSNPNDGIQVIMEKKRGGSDFKLPHEAPLDGYRAQYKSRTDSRGSATDISEDKNYFFRVRTRTNENGRLIQAHYGKIRGPISYHGPSGRIEFAYYLNPTSMDQNVEFDTKQNLFGRLRGAKGALGP